MPRKHRSVKKVKKVKKGKIDESLSKDEIIDELRSRGIIIPRVCDKHPCPACHSLDDDKTDSPVEQSWLSWLSWDYL